MFIAGDKWYIKYKPEGSVFIKMCKCIGSAIKNKWKTEQENRTEQHWIDYADATVSKAQFNFCYKINCSSKIKKNKKGLSQK